MTEPKYVVGVFDGRPQAERALLDLRRAGFRDDQVAMVMHHDALEVTDLDAAKAAQVTGQSKAVEGAAAGAAAGAVVGGLLALAPALVPGVGTVYTVGTLAAALVGLAGGTAGGGIVGGLIGADFPEEEARVYEQELKAGRVLVGVKPEGRRLEATDILHFAGAHPPLVEAEAVGGVGAQF